MSQCSDRSIPAPIATVPFGVDIDLVDGVMAEPDRILVANASDMRGHYRDETPWSGSSTAGDPLHYEVFEKTIPEDVRPPAVLHQQAPAGRVGDECFMTKGHYHTVAGTAEIYLCIRGTGSC